MINDEKVNASDTKNIHMYILPQLTPKGEVPPPHVDLAGCDTVADDDIEFKVRLLLFLIYRIRVSIIRQGTKIKINKSKVHLKNAKMWSIVACLYNYLRYIFP